MSSIKKTMSALLAVGMLAASAVTAAAENAEPTMPDLTGQRYLTIDEISPGTSVRSFSETVKLSENEEMRIYNDDGIRLFAGDYIGNGASVIIFENSDIKEVYRIKLYGDLNGDGLITDDDQRAIGNPTRPAYTWGLNYGADYKGFFFSMNWTAATERSLVLDYFFRKPFGNNANNALMQFHDNRWTPATAETATVPRFATKSMDYNSYTSSLWVKNGNFLKLKTLTIGYNFKERKALKKLGISQLGIKFSGYNLLTFDSFKIMDPECTPGLTDSYPIIKIYNIGINLTF